MLSRRIKYIIGIFATIFLGAIGSGLWNEALQPMFYCCNRFLFKIATLGLCSFKNSIYISVAKGLHEEPSLMILLAIVTMLICTVVFLCLLLVHLRARIDGDTVIKGKAAQLIKNINQFIITKPKVLLCFVVLYVCVFYIFIFYRINYINLAITHFEQCYTICSPYLDSKEKDLTKSRFSQIKNKEDYLKVMNFLYERTKANSIECPQFKAL